MKKVKSVIALITVMALLLPSAAVAAEPGTVSPMASAYIQTFNADIAAVGNGDVVVEFTIIGTGYMDDIGATSIYLYEIEDGNTSLATTFRYGSYPEMMAEGKLMYTSSVTYYDGTRGNSYYAIVYFHAAKNNVGDTRSYTTETVTAY